MKNLQHARIRPADDSTFATGFKINWQPALCFWELLCRTIRVAFQRMKPRQLLPLVLGALLCCFLTAPVSIRAASKSVMVYYMPWFTAKPYSNGWGWHWTMNHFDPDRVNASGERQIASWYYPLIGPYDSSDPAVSSIMYCS